MHMSEVHELQQGSKLELIIIGQSLICMSCCI